MSPTLRLLALAPLGVLVGHALVPVLLHQHGHEAHAVLHSHGVATTLLLGGLIAAFVTVARALLDGWGPEVLTARRGLVLGAAQTVGYLAVEGFESAANGAAPSVSAGTLATGVLVQAALALVVIALLHLGLMAVETVRAAASVRPLRVRTARLVCPESVHWSTCGACGVPSVRGPPHGT